MAFDILPGTPGLDLAGVAHLLVPGRGRDVSGARLTPGGIDRVDLAANLFRQTIGGKGGRIVCSGYKSPADRGGREWSPPGSDGERFTGIPEADLMRTELLNRGIPDDAIRAERHSIDTVTNFLRSEWEGHFSDDRPVAIVAQRAHLQRMLSIIAPRTLRRPYVGVVVPEHRPQRESVLIDLVSRTILAGLPGDGRQAIAVATRRAGRIWRLAQLAGVRRYHAG